MSNQLIGGRRNTSRPSQAETVNLVFFLIKNVIMMHNAYLPGSISDPGKQWSRGCLLSEQNGDDKKSRCVTCDMLLSYLSWMCAHFICWIWPQAYAISNTTVRNSHSMMDKTATNKIKWTNTSRVVRFAQNNIYSLQYFLFKRDGLNESSAAFHDTSRIASKKPVARPLVPLQFRKCDIPGD